MSRIYDVYVMYIGVTNDFNGRVHKHRNKLVKGFTTDDISIALVREGAIASEKKNALVESLNPRWEELEEVD